MVLASVFVLLLQGRFLGWGFSAVGTAAQTERTWPCCRPCWAGPAELLQWPHSAVALTGPPGLGVPPCRIRIRSPGCQVYWHSPATWPAVPSCGAGASLFSLV